MERRSQSITEFGLKLAAGLKERLPLSDLMAKTKEAITQHKNNRVARAVARINRIFPSEWKVDRDDYECESSNGDKLRVFSGGGISIKHEREDPEVGLPGVFSLHANYDLLGRIGYFSAQLEINNYDPNDPKKSIVRSYRSSEPAHHNQLPFSEVMEELNKAATTAADAFQL